MNKKPRHPRLVLRGTKYYIRAAIPADIKDTYSKTEETYSLKTGDHNEAVKRCRAKSAEIDLKFDNHRAWLSSQGGAALDELTPEQIKHIALVYYTHLLDEDAETRSVGFHKETSDELHALPRPSFKEHSEEAEELDKHFRQQQAEGLHDTTFDDEVEEVLSWENISFKLSNKSKSRSHLAYALQGAAIKAYSAIKARNQGEPIDTPAIPGGLPGSAVKLSEAVKEWVSEKEKTSWSLKTKQEHEVWIEQFISACGDRPIDQYTKDDGRKFKQILLKLPPNWTKHKSISGLRIDQAATEAARIGLDQMSVTNVNKIIGFVQAFWNWADDNYDEAPANPLRKLKLPKKTMAREERDPFEVSALNKIFKSPIYTGFQSHSRWATKGNLIDTQSGRYWVPLIALYTGMRLGEIIQLYVSDIVTKEDIPCFDINDDGDDKNLKTHNSKRIIPIHPQLIELGILELQKNRKKKGEMRLFPDLPMGRNGYYSDPFSKFFSRFLVSQNLKSNKLTFHSFRHTFEDACRNGNVSKEIMDGLQGHKELGMSGRYGKGASIKTLHEAVKLIKYDGLNLEHLMK